MERNELTQEQYCGDAVARATVTIPAAQNQNPEQEAFKAEGGGTATRLAWWLRTPGVKNSKQTLCQSHETQNSRKIMASVPWQASLCLNAGQTAERYGISCMATYSHDTNTPTDPLDYFLSRR
ncbi:MAG UNVERIFIED_CONTAM: hypothetical protein LVR18_18075 [Planctomycetaceae bacterium]